MEKFMRTLIISGIVFFFVFVANFIIPIIPNKVYSLEKEVAYKKILNCASSYMTKETVFCNIYYTETDEEYINIIGSTIDCYYPLILKEFDIDAHNTGKPTFVIFPDEDSLMLALGFENHSAPMGVYYGGVINVLSPESWIKDSAESEAKERFLKEGPLIHELVHFALDLKANGNYPLWFTEGVALYYENKFTAFEWRPDLNEMSQYIALNDLQNNFKDIDEGLSYRSSFNLITGFVDIYGEDMLQNIISKLGTGESFSDFTQFFSNNDNS